MNKKISLLRNKINFAFKTHNLEGYMVRSAFLVLRSTLKFCNVCQG